MGCCMGKRVILTKLCIVLLVVLISGCGGVKAKELSPVSPLSRQELIDYYREDMNHTAEYEKRTSKIYREIINKTDVTDKNKELKLLRGYELIEAEISADYYDPSMVVSKNQFEYIKTTLDDKELIKEKVEKIQGGYGFYFVDVVYKIQPKATGQVGELAKYLGIHGLFKGIDYSEVDYGYVNSVNQALSYDSQEKGIRESKENKFNVEVNTDDVELGNNEDKVNEETTKDNTQGNIEESGNTSVSEEDASNRAETKDVIAQLPIRRPELDIKNANKLSGSAINQTAGMPELTMVYTQTPGGGLLSGYGIFPQGGYELSVFGVDRSKLSGKAMIRYVYKENIDDGRDVSFIAVYPVSITIDNKLKSIKSDIMASAIKVEVAKVVDRADRAIMNSDLTALMSGEIFEDIGPALLYSNKGRNNYILSNTSESNVICRKNNNYLVSVQQIMYDGIKNSEIVLKYNNQYYMSIIQYGDKFIINDYVCVESKLLEDPNLGADSSYVKRLVALSSGGNISQKNKKEIEKLMESLYYSSTSRKLTGMYNCFNDDIELLSNDHREYMNSKLRGLLVREGADVGSKYSGKIIKWISAADRQAEFIADEIIQYKNKSGDMRMKTYYLVSCYKDKWVIDDMKILENDTVKDK